MAAKIENQNPSSKNGSSQIETLYDEFQKSLPVPPEEKSSRGKLYKFGSCIFNSARKDTSSRNKDQKRNEPADAAGSNGNATQNNTGEGSLSQKRKNPKTYVDPLMARGFEYDEMSLEIMLLKGGWDDFKTIGVVGPPGVGKTTLCKSILKNDRVKSSYGPMIWVSISEKHNTEEELERSGVPEDIVEHISNERELPQLLNKHNQQFNDNKYLLVIDDVGEREEDSVYETLKDCFSNKLPKEKGGAVIVTCRSEEAAKKMVGDENLHRLQPLSDPRSCWQIYNDAREGFAVLEITEASKDAMEELMKRCGGLPGAARMMGEIKKRKAIREKASMSWALLRRELFKEGKKRRELIKRIALLSLDN